MDWRLLQLVKGIAFQGFTFDILGFCWDVWRAVGAALNTHCNKLKILRNTTRSLGTQRL